jgi:hypothetical protein
VDESAAGPLVPAARRAFSWDVACVVKGPLIAEASRNAVEVVIQFFLLEFGERHAASVGASFLFRCCWPSALSFAASVALVADAPWNGAEELACGGDSSFPVVALSLVLVLSAVAVSAESGCAFDELAATALTVPGHDGEFSFFCLLNATR